MEQLRETLENRGLIMRPDEVSLDLQYSHPVTDSFSFNNSKVLTNLRTVLVSHMLQNHHFRGHIDILSSMLGLCLVDSNKVSNVVEALNNYEQTGISPLATLVQDPRFSRYSDEDNMVEWFQDQNDLPFQVIPL
jgi:hypothetical protein